MGVWHGLGRQAEARARFDRGKVKARIFSFGERGHQLGGEKSVEKMLDAGKRLRGRDGRHTDYGLLFLPLEGERKPDRFLPSPGRGLLINGRGEGERPVLNWSGWFLGAALGTSRQPLRRIFGTCNLEDGDKLESSAMAGG